MKVCGSCKNELPLQMFGKHSRNPDGLQYCCKLCKSKADKISRSKNLDKIKARKKEYYLENKEYIIEKVNEYISNNRVKHNNWAMVARNKLKLKVFLHYCDGQLRCKNCNQSELSLLTIDHIDGDGNKHRKEVGIKTGYSTYRWLKRNNFPDGFQVLCWNCQFRKRSQELVSINSTEKQIRQKAYNRAIKIECLSHYGSICSCGEDDPIVLTLDHVNDDGGKHRKEVGAVGLNFYLYLRKNNFPNDPPMQVRCLSCQYIKRGLNERKQREDRQTAID